MDFLCGLPWNQLNLEGLDHLRAGTVMLIAMSPKRSPKPIGTAFIINACENHAIALTAAHNFEGIKDVQNPYKKHHSTALPEFLTGTQEINLDRRKLRVLCFESDEAMEGAIIARAFVDERADIAIFILALQNHPAKSEFFNTNFHLDEKFPDIGAFVGIMGHMNMEVPFEERDGKGCEEFHVRGRLMFRIGRITNIHNDGHILCRESCVETSIPIFPGMSGSPVFRLNEKGGETKIKPFGIVSSDPEDDKIDKNDRNIIGSSIVTLIKPKIIFDEKGRQKVSLQMGCDLNINNGEFNF